VEQFPDNAEFLYHLGTLYESIEAYDRAEEYLKRGLEAAPEDTRLHFRLGVVYDKWGRKEDSIASMKTVIRLDPKHANALNYLGYTYADMGKNLDEAERLVKEALKYKPDDGYITDSLGWVYFQKGLYEKSLQYLNRAVELVPDDPVILEHLGDVHLKLSNKEKALEYYRRSLDLREKDKEPIEEKIRRLTEGNS
jgi:tetratricopeptide (TPR) repeat protein